jgi:hypothetical protein
VYNVFIYTAYKRVWDSRGEYSPHDVILRQADVAELL